MRPPTTILIPNPNPAPDQLGWMKKLAGKQSIPSGVTDSPKCAHPTPLLACPTILHKCLQMRRQQTCVRMCTNVSTAFTKILWFINCVQNRSNSITYTCTNVLDVTAASTLCPFAPHIYTKIQNDSFTFTRHRRHTQIHTLKAKPFL